MKNARLALISAVLCLLPACSEDNPSQPLIPSETLLTSATIGSNGGVLLHDGFTLTVPSGAFAGSASLDLYESDTDPGLGSNVISPLYRIDGIPQTFADTLYISIACTGATSEECFILSGDVSTGQSIAWWPATESDGTVNAAIPPRTAIDTVSGGDLGKITDATEKKDYFAAIANFKSSYTHNNVLIVYPAYLVDYVDDISAYVEEARAALQSLGMDRWPVLPELLRLFVQPVKSLTPGAIVRLDLHSQFGPAILIEESLLGQSNLPRLRIALHKAVMAISQEEYANWVWGPYGDRGEGWWHTAVREWFPVRILGASAYPVPDSFSGHETEPFKGMMMELDWVGRQHGYGMPPLVSFLVAQYGSGVLGEIYGRLALREPLFDAVVYGAGVDVYNWLPMFFERYVRGEYYNVSASTFLNHTAGHYTIASAADTLASFYRGCPHLGAQLYRFDLDYEDIAEDAGLTLSISGGGVNQDYVTLVVYTLQNGVLQYADAGNEVRISGLRELTLSGKDIVAVAVNSYSEMPDTGTTALTVTARVDAPRVFDFNRAEIFIADITYDCYEEWEDTTRQFENHHGGSWQVNGAFVDSVFSGLTTWTSGDYVCTLFVTLTVDPVTLDLLEFNAWEHCGRPTYRQHTSIQNVPGMLLPFVGSENYLNWWIGGSASVCEYFDYKREIWGFPPQYEHWYTICTSSTCLDGDPSIRIEVYKE